MAKTLNQFLEGYLKVKNPDEQKFVDKHVTAKHPDRNGNGDEVFNGSKVKTVDRRKDRHGYNPGEDEKVYEELKGSQHKIDANKNGKVDAHDFHLLRKKKKVAEEAEQIDELETATLRSYRTKARAQGNAIVDKMKMGGGDWSKDQKDTKTLRKRAAGANMSGKQLVKRGESLRTEEAEQIDELSRKTMGSYVGKAVDDFKNRKPKMGEDGQLKKMQNRTVGVNRVLKKVYGEEAEQIDELSRDTLRRYRMKAKSIGDNEKGDIGYRSKGRELAGRKTHGGQYGIPKAKVMAKEEAELEEKINMDKASMGTVIKDFQKSDAPQFKGKSQDKRRAMAIAAKLTAERGGKPLNKEEKLANLLGDLTETHKRTMLAVFDKLNENNQKKFLEACVTPEGVEQMLDFSISHRGE
jgi:hypothetical protein